MKSASISEIKKELQNISEKELAGLCLRLAKYKKENKEFLGYLLFDAIARDAFIKNLKVEIDENFNELKLQPNLYYVKKGLRKILRIVNRYCKFMDDKGVTAGLLIYFSTSLVSSGISWKKNKLIVNLYAQQVKKINTLVNGLHEDLRFDYQADLEKLSEEL